MTNRRARRCFVIRHSLVVTHDSFVISHAPRRRAQSRRNRRVPKRRGAFKEPGRPRPELLLGARAPLLPGFASTRGESMPGLSSLEMPAPRILTRVRHFRYQRAKTSGGRHDLPDREFSDAISDARFRVPEGRMEIS